MLAETRQAIRDAFLAGQLKVATVDPHTGEVGCKPLVAVQRHHTAHKPLVRVTLDGATVTCTQDHSLFQGTPGGPGVEPVEAGMLCQGYPIVTVGAEGVVTLLPVLNVEVLPPTEYTYDLSVPGPQNFVLSNGVLAHNSYSIGGVSLDIEKSSKYESLKQNAESMFDKATEAKARTVKFIRGLQQPRFGLGVRSSFGPALGRGILSPRNFT